MKRFNFKRLEDLEVLVLEQFYIYHSDTKGWLLRCGSTPSECDMVLPSHWQLECFELMKNEEDMREMDSEYLLGEYKSRVSKMYHTQNAPRALKDMLRG